MQNTASTKVIYKANVKVDNKTRQITGTVTRLPIPMVQKVRDLMLRLINSGKFQKKLCYSGIMTWRWTSQNCRKLPLFSVSAMKEFFKSRKYLLGFEANFAGNKLRKRSNYSSCLLLVSLAVQQVRSFRHRFHKKDCVFLKMSKIQKLPERYQA